MVDRKHLRIFVKKDERYLSVEERKTPSVGKAHYRYRLV